MTNVGIPLIRRSTSYISTHTPSTQHANKNSPQNLFRKTSDMVKNSKRQLANLRQKSMATLGAYMDNDEDTPGDTLPPATVEPMPKQHAAPHVVKAKVASEPNYFQAYAMHEAQQSNEARKVLEQRRASAKTSTEKENAVHPSLRGPPRHTNKYLPQRVGEPLGVEPHRDGEPLGERLLLPNIDTTKKVADVTERPFIVPDATNVSPSSVVSTNPSTNNSSSGCRSRVLYSRKGAPDRSSALALNIAREDWAGVARQLCSEKSLNPIIPFKAQPPALTIFRKELLKQYAHYENEDGTKLRLWLQSWLKSQRKQADPKRTEKKNGETVYLPTKHQEELAVYKAQKEAMKNPVARLTYGPEEGTSSGGPSRVDSAQPTTATPTSQLQSVDTTHDIKPCVLTDEDVDTFVAGDGCLLAPRECLDDGKCRETFNAQLAMFVVRSFLLKCISISESNA